MSMRFAPFLREIIRGKSVGRALLFAHLESLFKEALFAGEKAVLELGAEPASHQRTFPSAWRVTGANKESYSAADICFDADQAFPFLDGAFDGVVCFNTLSVLRDPAFCITESLRIARSFAIFNAPNIAAYAPHPRDLHRFARDGLHAILLPLRDQGRIVSYRVIPVGGSFTSAWALVEPYARWRIFRIPLSLACAAADRFDVLFHRECPAQYLIVIEK